MQYDRLTGVRNGLFALKDRQMHKLRRKLHHKQDLHHQLVALQQSCIDACRCLKTAATLLANLETFEHHKL